MDWLYRDIPVLGQRIHRIGIAGNFGIQPATFQTALDAGINYVFWTPKMKNITPVLRDALQRDRSSIVLATGPTFAFFGKTRKRNRHADPPYAKTSPKVQKSEACLK